MEQSKIDWLLDCQRRKHIRKQQEAMPSDSPVFRPDHIPVPTEILGEIARLGGFDAVYDVTVTKVPKQADTVILLVVKVFDGNAVEFDKRFWCGWLSASGLDDMAARLHEGIMKGAFEAGIVSQ
jgi:hypothetical protein